MKHKTMRFRLKRNELTKLSYFKTYYYYEKNKENLIN